MGKKCVAILHVRYLFSKFFTDDEPMMFSPQMKTLENTRKSQNTWSDMV